MRSNFGSFGLAGLVILGILGSTAGPALPASDITPGDTSPLVATWSDGGVTVNDLVTWWNYGFDPNRKPLTTLDDKEAFLNTVINAKLMIDKAESLGITQLPTVADFYRGRRAGMVTEKVLTRATVGRIKIDERDVNDVYAKRLTEMDLSQIVVPKESLAVALEDSIKAGVPFGDLAVRYSIAPTANQRGVLGTARWGDFAERFSAVAFALDAGQVSRPFQVPVGWCILRMDAKTLKAPADTAAEKRDIRARLEQEGKMRERASYLDSLKTAYDFKIDTPAAITLSTKYALAIEKSGQLEDKVRDADIVPDLSATDRAVPLVTYHGGALTTGEAADIIAKTPFQVRPRMDEPEDLIPFLASKAIDSLVYAEGVKLGIDREPDVVAQVEKARRRKTLFAFYDYITHDATVPEDEARAYYEGHKDRYDVPAGWTISKIAVGTMEEADSIMHDLAGGASFEDIARHKSRDAFTATEGGNVGFLRKGDDQEFDGFLETMQPGERKVFRSLEGIVILWLQAKQEPRKATFEEARDAINQTLVAEHKDEIIKKWSDARRALLGVTINKDVLAGVVLK